MSGRKRLTDEEREAHRREHVARMHALNRAVYGGAGKGSKARIALLDEGDEIVPLVQRGDNRLRSNLGEGAGWKRPHRTSNS